MTNRPGPAAPQIPQRGMAEGGGSKVSTHRHPDGANSARTEHGALARREYGLLVLEEPADDPAALEPRDRRDDPEATMGTGGPYKKAKEMGYQNGQRALLACGHLEEQDKEQRLPERQRNLNACSHRGGGGPSARISYA